MMATYLSCPEIETMKKIQNLNKAVQSIHNNSALEQKKGDPKNFVDPGTGTDSWLISSDHVTVLIKNVIDKLFTEEEKKRGICVFVPGVGKDTSCLKIAELEHVHTVDVLDIDVGAIEFWSKKKNNEGVEKTERNPVQSKSELCEKDLFFSRVYISISMNVKNCSRNSMSLQKYSEGQTGKTDIDYFHSIINKSYPQNIRSGRNTGRITAIACDFLVRRPEEKTSEDVGALLVKMAHQSRMGTSGALFPEGEYKEGMDSEGFDYTNAYMPYLYRKGGMRLKVTSATPISYQMQVLNLLDQSSV